MISTPLVPEITVTEHPQDPSQEHSFVLWFDQVGIADVSLVGGKNASLGEMIQQLLPKGVRVPNGFATTAYAYRYFVRQAGLEVKLRQLLSDLDVEDMTNLRERGRQARSLVLSTPFPPELEEAIVSAYEQLCDRYEADLETCHTLPEDRKESCGLYGRDVDVAVRSSATAEDLPDASFAGQQETYLNVHGVSAVLEACHKCFASIFTDRAISYRTIKGFDHFEVALSVDRKSVV